MSWLSPSLLSTVTLLSILSGLKKWVHIEVTIFLRIMHVLCLQSKNLILNRILLIINTVFKQACPYQKLGSVSQGYLYVN